MKGYGNSHPEKYINSFSQKAEAKTKRSNMDAR